MLNNRECYLVKHLHDAGKGCLEIARIIDNRRVEKMLSKSDTVTDVLEHLHRIVSFYS